MEQVTAMSEELQHFCHARGCNQVVPPKLLMCSRHWRMVPRSLQNRVWKTYRTGQEIDKRPSEEYLTVMREAIAAVSIAETPSSAYKQQNLPHTSQPGRGALK
jgi:hypothetical protein